MPDPKPDDVDFHEETTDPLVADLHNFYKVEKWMRDNTKVDSLLYAGNNLDKAREIFAKAIKHRPRINLTIRRRTRVLSGAVAGVGAINRDALLLRWRRRWRIRLGAQIDQGVEARSGQVAVARWDIPETLC
jgi:hypothetical protein